MLMGRERRNDEVIADSEWIMDGGWIVLTCLFPTAQMYSKGVKLSSAGCKVNQTLHPHQRCSYNCL